MMGGAKFRALAVVSFPVRPGDLEAADVRDVALALQQIGRSIAAGHHRPTGTIVVPYQERTRMKVSIDLSGPNGRMWELDMKYSRLPPEYAAEIASCARSYAHYIENLPGGAGAGPAYSVEFKYEADGEELAGVAAPMADVFKGKAAKKGLLYSQAVQVQDAGIELLSKLQQGAHMEIKSGQRK